MATSGIRELHALLLERDRNRTALANGPRRIAAAEAAIAQQGNAVDDAKNALIGLQKLSDQKNLQFKMNQQKIVDQKSKLGMCKNNNEYDILNRQIEGELKQNEQLEGEYLGLLERIDSAKVRIGELTKELESRRAALIKVKADVSAAEAGLKAEVAKYDQLCAVTAAATIPAPQAEYYKRLVGQSGADAIALVVSAVCEGCDTEIPPQHNIKVRIGEVILCNNCGRFLCYGE